MKVIFICRDLSQNNDGGRVVTKRNLLLLQNLCEDVYTVETPKQSILQQLYNIFFLRSLNHSFSIKRIIRKKVLEGYTVAFLDSSLYGQYARYLKKHGVTVYSFYHNVEYVYFLEKCKVERTLKNSLLKFYIKYNEKLTTKYSDKIISICSRDSLKLHTYYNRSADVIIPTSFSVDTTPPELSKQINLQDTGCLFVGSNFYANREGVLWFIENVLPHIKCNFIVVGSICDYLKELNLSNKNLVLKGFVDDLTECYNTSLCVVSPIFSGSGLKTKTIEAIKYGKYIVGSKESFVGVEDYIAEIGSLCNNADDYIDIINNICSKFDNNCYPLTDKNIYKVFVENFSHESAENKFKQLFLING